MWGFKSRKGGGRNTVRLQGRVWWGEHGQGMGTIPSHEAREDPDKSVPEEELWLGHSVTYTWLLMVTHGYTWSHMVTHGYTWLT